MISEAEALEKILSLQGPGPLERVTLGDALRRFSGRDIYATVPNPRFDASSMDGYAVRVAESGGGSALEIQGEQPAGLDRGLVLEAGKSIRIFTGAPIPAGADAVIMQEDVRVIDRDGVAEIECCEPVEMGENIRMAGADLCLGQRILSRGQRLTPARLALLASQGISEVETYVGLRVAVLTTGDELAAAGDTLRPGQIYNSNQTLLHSLLTEIGVHTVTMAHCGDDYHETVHMLDDLTGRHDVVLIVGGVSVGEHDQVKPALQALGLKPDLWRVKIKPGKPFLFAHRNKPVPLRVFGLPGNPVSAFVTFLVFVRPALLKQMGAGEGEFTQTSCLAELAIEISNPGDRPHYVRGNVRDDKFVPLGLQQSHAILGLSQSNALLRMEAGAVLNAGALCRVLLF